MPTNSFQAPSLEVSCFDCHPLFPFLTSFELFLHLQLFKKKKAEFFYVI